MYVSPKAPPGSYSAGGKLRDPRLVEWETRHGIIRQKTPDLYEQLRRQFMTLNHIQDPR
jgi:hypothetical protein